MFLVIKKNFNIFILLFLLNISYFGLEDFISFESQKTDQQLEKSYSGINTPLENQKTNNQLIKKKVQQFLKIQELVLLAPTIIILQLQTKSKGKFLFMATKIYVVSRFGI